MGSFASIAGAETALTREFGRHVFEIAALLRVSHTLYNHRVWVVETVGFELATPHPWLSSFDHIFGHAGLTNLDALMPLNDKTPSLFLEAILSWGGAISAAATFVVVVSCLSDRKSVV